MFFVDNEHRWNRGKSCMREELTLCILLPIPCKTQIKD
jgi:hypothetical protein